MRPSTGGAASAGKPISAAQQHQIDALRKELALGGPELGLSGVVRDAAHMLGLPPLPRSRQTHNELLAQLDKLCIMTWGQSSPAAYQPVYMPNIAGSLPASGVKVTIRQHLQARIQALLATPEVITSGAAKFKTLVDSVSSGIEFENVNFAPGDLKAVFTHGQGASSSGSAMGSSSSSAFDLPTDLSHEPVDLTAEEIASL